MTDHLGVEPNYADDTEQQKHSITSSASAGGGWEIGLDIKNSTFLASLAINREIDGSYSVSAEKVPGQRELGNPTSGTLRVNILLGEDPARGNLDAAEQIIDELRDELFISQDAHDGLKEAITTMETQYPEMVSEVKVIEQPVAAPLPESSSFRMGG